MSEHKQIGIITINGKEFPAEMHTKPLLDEGEIGRLRTAWNNWYRMLNPNIVDSTAMVVDDKTKYTWEEKIDNLVTLAKAVGRYLNAEEGMISPSTGSDYYRDARRKLKDAYEDFCKWRHDEPYVADEIKALIK